MKIKNLGPIKDAQIHLDRFNVFIGENGTGKTLAAYALYSFYNWFQMMYHPTMLKEQEIKRLVTSGNPLLKSMDSVVDFIAEEASRQFNQLNDTYFENFFQDQSTFLSGKTTIEVDADDVKSVYNVTSNGTWYFEWPLTRKATK